MQIMFRLVSTHQWGFLKSLFLKKKKKKRTVGEEVQRIRRWLVQVACLQRYRVSRTEDSGQKELHCVFVDQQKAYDRVPRQEVWYCMIGRGVCEGGAGRIHW